jgi:hypothetical protein
MKIYSIRQDTMVPERLAVSYVRLINPQTGLRDQRYERDFILNFIQTYGTLKSALSEWTIPEFFVVQNLTYPKAPLNDIGQLAGMAIISEKSGSILGDLLHIDSELLPMVGNKIEVKGKMKPLGKNLRFYIVHHLQARNALDFSKLDEDPTSNYISYLEKYEFRIDQLENAHFFKIKHHPGYFASETFIKTLEQHNLRGMVWELIWDSENPDYIDEHPTPEVWADIKARHAAKQK